MKNLPTAVGNKFTTYLLYAIGEIVLVVIGILIAVSINNWNGRKNDRKKELSYLTSYANDLNKNIEELNRVIDRSGYLYQLADTLIIRFVASRPTSQPELDSMVYQLMGYTLYLSKEGTTENLLGAGSLEIIQNTEIRASFVTQEADQKRLREVEKGAYDSFNEYLLYLKNHSKMYNYPLGNPMIDQRTQANMMKDQYLLNVLDDISFKNKNLQGLYDQRKNELVVLLEMVNTEIQKFN